MIESQFSSFVCERLHNLSHRESRGTHQRALLRLPPAQREGVYEKCQVSHMGAQQPQYYNTACPDQKKGTHLLHYVLYIPSATQASTHNIATHGTSPWVGGSTAPPSPPTAGPCSGKGAEGLSHKRGALQSCEVEGRQCCQFTEVTIMDLYFSTQCQNTHVVHRCHVLQHFALSITASGIPSHPTDQAVWKAPADRAALPVAN